MYEIKYILIGGMKTPIYKKIAETVNNQTVDLKKLTKLKKEK